MRDDTPTNPQPIEVLAAQLEAFRKDPSEADLYYELRTELRKSGAAEELAEIGELRAPHERDRLRAADILSEAGEARYLLGNDAQGEKNMRQALSLDPANERAAARFAEVLMVAERFAEAAEILEAELAELERRADSTPPEKGRRAKAPPFATRRGNRHRMLAQLWDGRLGRVDRALEHWQQAWQLEPDKGDALEAARSIYQSLGDEKMVARLYEAELDTLGQRGPRGRRAKLELELGRILMRQGDAQNAAGHLENALRLDRNSMDAREVLAEVYASASFSGQDEHQQRASELYVELGRNRMKTEDEEGAINYLRRALGVDPYSRAGTDALEKALASGERWDELDRLYRHRATMLEDAGERKNLLVRRVQLYEKYLHDTEALTEVLVELASTEPPLGKASQRLRELYRETENWAALAALIEHELPALEQHPEHMCNELLELATIVREHLGDRDKSAEMLHRVLSINSRNEEALARYGDHFRERRDWRGLADLLEFAIDNAREAGASVGELVRQLEDVAKISELRLGDVDRAIYTWRRIEELEPSNPKAGEALRRLMSRAKMWEQLVGVLEHEAQAAQTPQERSEALRRIAQVYRERQVNPRRAIALYEEVLTMYPGDDGVLKALSELYEREGDDAGLAHTLRRQLELDVQRMLAEIEASGRRAPTAREWPVAKRVERLTALRRLASMYEQRLADVEGVVFACGGILEILPGDRDALDRMERVLEKAGDIERLEQTLEYHASSATGPAERAKVLRRLANLATDQEDDVRAMERWEATLKVAPNDGDALDALATLYERHERWGELATVLERAQITRRAAEDSTSPGTSAASKRAEELERYARVVDERLGDVARATRAWQKLLEVRPRDRDALDALARLYEGAGRWRDLAEVLARQAPLHIDDDPQRAAQVALQRAQLLEERLGAPAEAAKALEALLSDLDASNIEAHKSLRRLYEARGDFEAAVRIAEREMYLTDEPREKIARGLEIGLLCRDRLGDATRALQAFERVLSLRGDHEEALTAAAELYAKVGDWRNHIRTLERRIDLTAEGRERRGLMIRIGQATAERLEDHKGAFRWFRNAHEHAPDSSTISELRRAAEAYGLWRELADVYEDERRRLTGEAGAPIDRASYVSASRELAAITERRLNSRQRAMNVLHDALKISPNDADLLSEIERIAVEANQRSLWQLLLDCLDVPLETSGPEGRVQLHARRARILEERLEDDEAAVEELLKAFAWAPEREETRLALYELADRTLAWKNVVAVEAALFQRATTPHDRVAILRRKAHVLEENLKESVRAFRTHLIAFLLSPEDSETVAHLWRLARAIGNRYREADKTPRTEAPAAYVQPPSAVEAVAAAAAPTRAPRIHIASTRPGRGEETQELSISDLLPPSREVPVGDLLPGTTDAPIAGPTRQDQTMPIDLSELEMVDDEPDDEDDDAARIEDTKPTPREDATIELRTEDLIQALGARESAPAPQRPSLPGLRPERGKGPPPPPPRPPQIKRQEIKPPPPPARRRQAPKRVKRTPVPKMPLHAYASPWEEFATAYGLLPANDNPTKLRWLFKAAEVWETGAEDIGKAFDILARALEIADDDAEPRARLHRLAGDHEAWDRLAELYENAAEEASTAATAIALLMEISDIRVQQNRPRETEALYRRVLGMRPDHAAARERLEELYRSESRWVDLAASLEERTDPRLGTAAPEAERPAMLRELASIYREKLQRQHDAIDALKRLQGLVPDDLELLRELADLYGVVHKWSKVIETLNHIADLADGTADARAALHRVAGIYETELELPDRAIDAYSQIVASWPDDSEAYAALDRLYQSHARWNDLSDILRRRAALTRDSNERSQLLRRRAQVLLDWLDSPEDAAAALRHARTITPDDPELASELVQALVRASREREAAAVLEGRISTLKESGGGRGDIAALLIRLAGLRAEQLGNPDSARTLLEEALALVPDHPTALAALARLAETQEDPRAYATARLREADAVSDPDAKVTALMAAGETLRDRCEDIDAARAAFEQVIELRPYHADATWALAGLVEQGGDIDSATALLEKRLEDETISDEDRAQLLTQLGALARSAGIDVGAERRLAEALNVAPMHIPAIIAMADLMAETERFEDLAAFVDDVLPTLEEADTHVRAELHRRLAIAYDALGRVQDAYQTLLAADKLHRGDLMIKLALGENRYRARRWREAALHLGALATHEDAPLHPAEVAEGLYHAALAEIRSLRPEKATGLYERALELKPNYAPALHALAEQAMEQGDPQRAADLLTRQATATDDPAERMKLFEALGDLALMTLHDEDRARICYEAAVNAADPLEAQHLALLEKLLERQDLAGDNQGAARTAELMASFGADAAARASRYTSAAESYLAAGDLERARAAAERAVDADPYDLTGVTVLSKMMLDARDYDDAAAMLGRALSGSDDANDELAAARKAHLWYALAEARGERGDTKGAVGAHEKAIALAPDSAGAMESRRQLLKMWADDDSKRDVLLGFRRTLAADTGELDDILRYARALCRAKNGDGGRAILELAESLGHTQDVHDSAFMAQNPARVMARDEAYRGTLTDDLRHQLIDDPDEGVMSGLLSSLWEAAALLWSDPEDALERCGVVGAQRVSAKVTANATSIFPRVAAALHVPATVLYTTEVPDAADVQVVCVSAPIVVLGPRLLGIDGEAPTDTELRFILGRAAEMARPERVIACGLPREDLDNLLASVLRVFGPEALHGAIESKIHDVDVRRAHDELLRTTLPVRLRRALEEQLATVRARDIDPQRFLRACDRAADRAGLLVCGDFAVAAANAGNMSEAGRRMTRHLVHLALQPGYLETRALLGVGVRG